MTQVACPFLTQLAEGFMVDCQATSLHFLYFLYNLNKRVYKYSNGHQQTSALI
jgi:hypothetical protein